MAVREAYAIRRLLVADTHESLLFFTDRGRVFQLRAHEVPDSSRIARGTPIVNLIEIDPNALPPPAECEGVGAPPPGGSMPPPMKMAPRKDILILGMR